MNCGAVSRTLPRGRFLRPTDIAHEPVEETRQRGVVCGKKSVEIADAENQLILFDF
jgi:hypothetical protein